MRGIDLVLLSSDVVQRLRRCCLTQLTQLTVALYISVISAPLFVGCGASVPREDATRILLEQLTIEEARLMQTCRELNASEPAQLRALLDDPKTPMRLKNELLHETRSGLSALFKTLQVDSACAPNDALNYYLKVQNFKTRVGESAERPSACLKAIEDRFKKFGQSSAEALNRASSQAKSLAKGTAKDITKDIAKRSLKSVSGSKSPVLKVMMSALLDANLTAQELLEDPLKITRQLDLSPAIVSAILTLSGQMETLVERLSSVVPVGGGIARVAMDRLAAELLALTLERVLNTFESQQLLSRVAVSRRACRLYQAGERRDAVTERVLKRLILRFDRSSTTQGAPWGEFCAQHQSLCSDLIIESKLVPAPTLPWGRVTPELITRTLTPPLPDVDYSVKSATRSGARHGQLLAEAARGCMVSAEGCTLNELSARAGVLGRLKGAHEEMNTQRGASPQRASEGSGDMRPPMAREISPKLLASLTPPSDRAQLDELLVQQRDLADQLERSRAEVSRLHAIDRLQREELSRANQLLGLLVGQMKSCRREMDEVKRRRLEFARDILKLSESTLTCRSGDASQLQAAAELSGVSISRDVLCDPLKPFTFDLNTEGLFAKCSDEPLATTSLDQLVSLTAALKSEEVMIIGHSDQTTPRGRCARAFPDNATLSEARARVAGRYVSDQLKSRGIQLIVQTLGVGASDLHVDCTHVPQSQTATCHAKNRRIKAQILSGSELNLNPAKCASN